MARDVDQDSLIEPGALAGLLDLYRDHPECERIGIMTMGHRDPVTGRDCYFPRDVITETPEWRSLRTAITSGSIVRTDVFRRVGGFEEKLFIDCVDHEFCLRCRSHGLLVIEGRRQSMSHSLGETAVRKLGSIPVPVSNHSATRRYYITRNQLEVSRKYLPDGFLLVLSRAVSSCGKQHRHPRIRER
jgi:rhamnosyltransferase